MQKSDIKVSFVSLGCDKNLVDSEIMLGLIDEAGYTITPDESEADVIVVNTCGFIADASEESIEMILDAAEYKSSKCKALIVAGCLAQRYEKEILNEIPEIDAVLGVGSAGRIAEAVEAALNGEKPFYMSNKNNALKEEDSYKRILSTPGHFAYLKIAEGCDNNCAYCTIPSIRGKYRSRTIESLAAETALLAEKGVRELIIVAQDTTRYGIDIYGAPKLPELLREISKTEGIEWIRLMYAYPENITDEIINEMSSNNKVCHYIDMPVQHASDRILKLMGRRSTSEKIRSVVNNLRSSMPDIVIRTTLIAGFPGETEEDFEFLKNFVVEVKFDRLGVFAYSQEEGTRAALMDGQIDEDEKQRRKDILMETQKNVSKEKCQSKVGMTLQVIVEGKLPEEEVYIGRSYMDAYEVDGIVFFKHDGELLAGDFVLVKITEASDYDLIGQLVYEEE